MWCFWFSRTNLSRRDLDRVELRRQRLREIVGVAAERVVRDAVLRGRRDDRFGVRLGDVAYRRTFDLGDAHAVAAHALDERGQLLRDLRRIDVARIGLHGRADAAADHLDGGFGDLVGERSQCSDREWTSRTSLRVSGCAPAGGIAGAAGCCRRLSLGRGLGEQRPQERNAEAALKELSPVHVFLSRGSPLNLPDTLTRGARSRRWWRL